MLRVLLFGACLAALDCKSQEGGDMQAQILFAHQTADLMHLRSLHQTLLTQVHGEHPTPAARYHLAHAAYRIALLARSGDRAVADGLQECVDQMARIEEEGGASAETLALQSVCYLQLAHERRLQGVFLRARAAERIARAVALDAHNPRVRLAQARQKLETAGDAGPVPPELAQAAALFDQSSATSEEKPGWGHAETYLLMGHALRVRGDALGARNWIEKALIAAPDYKAAQVELGLLNH